MVTCPCQTVVSCVKAVQIFVNIRPSIISSAKATTLLPYLKNAPTVGEPCHDKELDD